MKDKVRKKKLIEVAIPLEAINRAAAREKSIRHGHPSTLHLWWARRPLAACRAVLFAQLVDDPSNFPKMFPSEEEQERERKRLFKIMEDLIVWENSTSEPILERAHAEIRRCCGDKLPSVYDPFSGGGSIPLEAQRLGLPAFGSDLNPVAVTIGKAMIEIPAIFKDEPPVNAGGKKRTYYRNAEGLAEDVEYYGSWMKERAFARIGKLYPQINTPKDLGGGKATIIAWIWARTVPSPDPAFDGTPVPIASSFALSTKHNKQVWVEPVVIRDEKRIEFRIRTGGTKGDIDHAKKGTKVGRGANFRCLLSNTAITPNYVKAQGRAGRMGRQLLAIVIEGNRGRNYLPPNSAHEELAESVEPEWKPDLPLPGDTRAFWTPAYGIENYGDMFTSRQLVALNTFCDLHHEVRELITSDALDRGLSIDRTRLRDGGKGAIAYSDAVAVYLSFAIDRAADAWSAQVSWRSSVEATRGTFARQALPMVWDFAEANPFSNSCGNWDGACLSWTHKALSALCGFSKASSIQHDAQTVAYPKGSVISTDPPYYDNIGYADLADYFYVWLRRQLKDIYPDVFGTLSAPKSEELVATPHRHGGRDNAEAFFLNGMRTAIENMASSTSDEFPSTIYYAFKQNEIEEQGISSTGWATFLQAVIEAGYSVVATWPMRTEKPGRMISVGTNALANSVVLVCRKRMIEAEVVTRAEFIRALKRELPAALHELQKANITPVDMPQASIGPGIGVFSRFESVLESDDSRMSVKTALQIINRELDAFLSEQEGEFDPDTRFAVTWFEQNGLNAGDFGDADNLARARGVSVDSVKHAGIVEAVAGKVRLLRRDELDSDWTPQKDRHLTVWECTHYLIAALQNQGEDAAALILKQIPPDVADAARDLAYRLHDICANKRKDAGEATAYNSLIAVWPDLTAIAATIFDSESGQEQLSML